MAEDILSQEEVDALLRGVSGEAEEAAAEAPGAGGVQPYDIGRQERIVRGRMPTLELVHERFARALRGALSNLMRRNVEISVAPVRVLHYSEFLRNLVVPANLNLVQVKPLRGTGLMVFEPNLVFQVIDTLFGGQGKLQTRIEGRELTPTEMRIVTRMLNLAFDAYQKAWQPVHPVTLEHVRSEINPQFANIAMPSEVGGQRHAQRRSGRRRRRFSRLPALCYARTDSQRHLQQRAGGARRGGQPLGVAAVGAGVPRRSGAGGRSRPREREHRPADGASTRGRDRARPPRAGVGDRRRRAGAGVPLRRRETGSTR